MFWVLDKEPDSLKIKEELPRVGGAPKEECIDIHFERSTVHGFDSIRIKLPTYEITIWEGNYTDKEIEFFKQVVKNSSDLFYKYAKEGGLKLA